MTTTISRSDTIAGMRREYLAFADLVDTLTPEQWAAPSRCAGADVRDVAGHVVGLAEDVAKGVPGSRTFEEEAATVRDDTPQQAAARLRAALDATEPLLAALDDEDVWNGPSAVPDLTLGRGVLTLWYDTYVHADDVRAGAGLGTVEGPGLAASIEYLRGELEQRGWPRADEVRIDGAEPFVTHDFVLAATGRIDPATLGLDPAVNIYAE
jgi:uncharacterized protein (TIGR03083 family)